MRLLVITLVLAFTTEAAAQPGIAISKTAPLSGNGSPSSPLKITACANGEHYVSNGTAWVCAAAGGGGGSISDGDKGDVVVASSGASWTLDTNLTLSGTTLLTGVSNFSSNVAGRGWYVTNNELNQGYGYANSDIGYLNYSSVAAGGSQFRDIWIGNGKQAATSVMYVSGVASRVGINNNSPAKSLDVTGTLGVSGQSTIGDLASTAGVMSWGPLGGNGGLYVNPTTGQAYFSTFGSTANPWGFGFGVAAPVSMIDLNAQPYAPGTASSSRTDSHETLMHGLATSNYDTTAAAIRATGIFFDSSYTKTAGANDLYDVLMRLDANGYQGAGVTSAWALWIDKGELVMNSHFTVGVRPSTGGGATASPVITACGTSPTRRGTDVLGEVTTGSGGPTSCTVTFQFTWIDHAATAVTPVCRVWADDGKVPTVTVRNSTTLTWTWTGAEAVWQWSCGGIDQNIPGP